MVVFAVIHLTPGDPAILMLGPSATPADVLELRTKLGLEEAIHVQYGKWLWNALQGDLGDSIWLRTPVLGEVFDRFVNTVILAAAAFIVSTVVGVSLGVLAGIRQNSWMDRSSMLVSLIGVSMPGFWLGLMLIILFSVQWDLLPSAGMRSPAGDGGVLDVLKHLLLPALTVGGLQHRHRGPADEVVRCSRSSGRTSSAPRGRRALKEWVIVHRHALKNALIPVVTVLGVQLGALLSSSVLIEFLFAWPGVGSFMIDAIGRRDLPLVQAITLVTATAFVLINLIVDLSYAYLDPQNQIRVNRHMGNPDHIATRFARQTAAPDAKDFCIFSGPRCDKTRSPSPGCSFSGRSSLLFLLAPVLPLREPDALKPAVRLTAWFSTTAYPLGTDELGRDMLSRLVWGGRVSLWAGIAAAGISMGFGLVIGLVSGYTGKWADLLSMRLIDILLAFPPLILAIAVVASLGPGLRNAVIVLRRDRHSHLRPRGPRRGA